MLDLPTQLCISTSGQQTSKMAQAWSRSTVNVMLLVRTNTLVLVILLLGLKGDHEKYLTYSKQGSQSLMQHHLFVPVLFLPRYGVGMFMMIIIVREIVISLYISVKIRVLREVTFWHIS